MQTCKLEIFDRSLTNMTSDGATPEEKTKQILAVAPIVKGQSRTPAASGLPSQQTQQPSQPPTQQHQQPSGHNDLIDFGQAETVPVSAVPERGSSVKHTTQGPPGLQEPLIPGAPIQRVDTATKELDEFVDAKP